MRLHEAAQLHALRRRWAIAKRQQLFGQGDGPVGHLADALGVSAAQIAGREFAGQELAGGLEHSDDVREAPADGGGQGALRFQGRGPAGPRDLSAARTTSGRIYPLGGLPWRCCRITRFGGMLQSRRRTARSVPRRPRRLPVRARHPGRSVAPQL